MMSNMKVGKLLAKSRINTEVHLNTTWVYEEVQLWTNLKTKSSLVSDQKVRFYKKIEFSLDDIHETVLAA